MLMCMSYVYAQCMGVSMAMCATASAVSVPSIRNTADRLTLWRAGHPLSEPEHTIRLQSCRSTRQPAKPSSRQPLAVADEPVSVAGAEADSRLLSPSSAATATLSTLSPLPTSLCTLYLFPSSSFLTLQLDWPPNT